MKLTQLTYDEARNRVSARVDGTTLWFESNGETHLPYASDLFLLATLLPAMAQAQPIKMDNSFSVSRTLLANLASFQDIFTQWYPHLNKVALDTPLRDDDNSPKPVSSGCLFSGGVDSLYTLMQNEQEVDSLLLCIGMDLQLEEQQRIHDTQLRMSQLAKQLGKTLITITTNIRHVFPTLESTYAHAAIFAGLGLAVGLKRLYIPASHTLLELFPWGSHPLTDPLLSNGTTEVIHHGATSRMQKTAYLAQYQWLIDELRVCNTSDQYNCGQCEKCLRTMTALTLLNKRSNALPELNINQLNTIKLYKQSAYTFWDDIRHAAKQHHHHTIEKHAQRICRRYEIKQALKQLLGRKSH